MLVFLPTGGVKKRTGFSSGASCWLLHSTTRAGRAGVLPMRTRVSVTSLLGALALFALANIQRARHSAEPSEIDFVVWDTEQTAWEGSNARRWSGLIPGTQKRETREVLQLSALRATLVPPHDHSTGWALRHGEAFSLLVRPTVNPVR